ncbi:MAG: hypothetical protein WDZ68_00130, partial [Candidatus Paceibacterota bacterium]
MSAENKKAASTKTKKVVSTKGAPVRKRSVPKSKARASSNVQSAKNSLSVLALSPFRFPLDVEKLAIQTARIGGVAFVFFGILFSYHYLESAMVGVVEQVNHSAALSCASGCTETINITPNVDFSYEAGTDGYIIDFTVPDALNLEVYAYQVKSGTYHKLGTAKQKAENDWEYLWLTNDYDQGEYWIKALVTN